MKGDPIASVHRQYRDVVVFVIGGGNYSEYHDLQKKGAKMTPQRNIVYGGTEICRPGEFALQLGKLGQLIN